MLKHTKAAGFVNSDVTHSWNPKCDTNELTRKTEIDSQTQETNTPKGKEGREKRGDWDGHGRLL